MLYLITTLASDVVDTGTEVITNERIVTIDEYWLNLVISTFLPIVVALVTKRFASGNTKAVTLLLLAAVTGTLTSVQAAGGTFEIESAITGTVVSFVTAVAMHFGLLGPANITGARGTIAASVPGGIGSAQPQSRAA
jgi:hypothetical protein